VSFIEIFRLKWITADEQGQRRALAASPPDPVRSRTYRRLETLAVGRTPPPETQVTLLQHRLETRREHIPVVPMDWSGT
jgi:hypothetical protein